jgi:hypothetical protein
MMQDDKICANKFPPPPTPVDNPFIYQVSVGNSSRTRLPIVDPMGLNNFNVNWGDESPIEYFNMVVVTNNSIISHLYTNEGTYTITISGQVESISFYFLGNNKISNNVTDVIQYGSLTGLTHLDFGYIFSDFIISATDIPPSSITNMDCLFDRSINVNISNWNLVNLTSINDAFFHNTRVSQTNYSAALVKMDSTGLLNQYWADGAQQSYDMPPSAAATARANLITKGWTIDDLGPA